MIAYNDFITKEGGFFRVGDFLDHTRTHDEWASIYMEKHHIEKRFPSSSYQLLHENNFVTVTYFEHIGFVFSDNSHYSESQIWLMEDLKGTKNRKGVCKCKKYL